MLHVTQNWNPGNGDGVYNNHAVGVFFNSVIGRWAIFNEDLTAMPAGADFNVTITLNRVFLPVILYMD